MNNTRQLGISIYPEHQDAKAIKEYVLKASKLGYTRIFASLLAVTKETKAVMTAKFTDVFKYARELNYDICLDVNPGVFTILDIKPDNLKFFNDLHVTTIRLDTPMDSASEALMTYNEYGINIELNISNGVEYIPNIISYKPIKDRLLGCHNFYPQKYTGLDYAYFIKATQLYKSQGLRTAAFVSSKAAKQGPWNVADGLPTLEMHRELPIAVQAKHLWATGLIDDVIIGNAFASDEELKALSTLSRYKVSLTIIPCAKTTPIEREIVELKNHFRRGDISPMMIRSTMSRISHKMHDFPAHDNTRAQERGQVVICNNEYGVYKGELQVIMQSMPNDKRKSVVGTVTPEELFLLDYIDSWSKFEITFSKKAK